ncbi:hypothetical protein [Weissella cibaria]|uniref:hypothetical protein n=1 Tax=Weissella cibaria TaxID=137591 RepID=UPI00106E2D4C|nr:hypothetical protein [Weissella cibaria]
MERQYSFEGRTVSESKAKETITSRSKQSLLDLVKDSGISGKFPLTLDEWVNLPYLNFDQSDLVCQLRRIWSLTEWEKEYLVDLNTVMKYRRKGSMIFPFDLNRLKDTGDVRFNEFMDIWDTLVTQNGGPEILKNNRINIKALNKVWKTVNSFEDEEININNLYERIIERRNVTLSEEEELSSYRKYARQKLDKLLGVSVDIETIKNLSLDKYTGATKRFVSNLLKLSMNFDGTTYLRYQSAWNVRVLANSLQRHNVSAKHSQKKDGNEKVDTKSEITVVNCFFNDITTMPAYDFPFDLEKWMKMGRVLHDGKEGAFNENLVIKKLRTSLPQYTDFLLNKVIKFDSETFQAYKVAWSKAQERWFAHSKRGIGSKSNLRTSRAKEGHAINYSYGNDGIVDKISVEKRIVAQPPVIRKRKVKIVATTGAAGVICGKKPEPVSKLKSKKKREHVSDCCKESRHKKEKAKEKYI